MKYLFCLLFLIPCSHKASAQDQKLKPDSAKKATVPVLDSVVVFNTGYQNISRYRAAGSFTQVDNRVLNLQVGSNIINRLESVASGVSFNKKNSTVPALAVRGLSTINGPTAPLIILDNFPFEGDINTINPNLIESITILKDATAASIWGTRAGNGVIVINTKKARYNQPFTIDFNSMVQSISKPDLFYSKPIASSDYIDVELFLFGKSYYNSILTDFFRPAVSPVVELLDRQSKGLVTPADAAAQIAAYRNVDVRNDYSRGIYRNALNSQYAINFSGGNERSSWTAAGGFDKNTGELSQQYQRYSARIENVFRPVANLKLYGSMYYTGSEAKTGREGYVSQQYVYPYTSLWDAAGNPLPAAREYRMGFTDTLGGGRLLDWHYYPADDYRHNVTTTDTRNILLNFSAQYQFAKSFSADFKYQYEYQQINASGLKDAQSFEARANINLFSQINSTTGAVTYIVPKGGILDITNSRIRSENYRGQLNYNKKTGEHLIEALAGAEIRAVSNNAQSYRTYGYDPQTITGTRVDFKNTYPIITTGDYNTLSGGDNNFEEQLKRFVSFYANGSYTYKSRYTVTLSGRRDASNLFGVSTNNRWTPLWSAGGAWNISREPFYRIGFLPYLKFRASYGYTGNADPRRSGIVTVYAVSTSSTTGFRNFRIRQFPNPDLRWEQVGITNLGLDFATKDNIFSGSLEWYNKKGTDLFAMAPVDYTAGINASGILKNVANMRGRGLDMVLNSRNLNGRLGWKTNVLFSSNADKVTKSYLTSLIADRYISTGDGISALEGQSVHAVIAYKSAGLDHNTGDPQGYINGMVSKDYASLTGTGTSIADLEYIGPGVPKYFGSLTNSFSYKAVSLDICISYKLHYFFTRTPLVYSNLFNGDKKSTADFAARWKQPGDELHTDVPSMVYPVDGNRDYFYARSSSLAEKGDHIRLQFINLAYNFKLSAKASRSQQRGQLYFNANNIGIIWRANKLGIDPDYAVTDIPPSTSFAAGIRIFIQ
ncbi:SusC/RagA family TonB-linked outer membrane protein [Ferruginibacter sp.]